MQSPLTQTEQLDLIEGNLFPAEAEALRARLREKSALLASIDAMTRDRARLREMETPVLTDDLVVSVEPVIARAGLTATSPGVYRRQVVRPHVPWRRIAVAAAVLVVAGVALLAMLDGLLPNGSNSTPDRLAGSDSTSSSAPQDSSREVRSAWPAEDRPNGTSDTLPQTPEFPATQTLVSGAPARDAGFVLVVSASDSSTDLPGVLAAELGTERRALVRNFTYADVDNALNALLAASTNVDGGRDVIASLHTFSQTNRMTNRERKAFGEVVRSSGVKIGGHLAGPGTLAPLPEDQLRFGELGAQLTLTIPAGEFIASLRGLSDHRDFAVRLIPAAHAEEPFEPSPGATSWDSFNHWRDAVAGLDALEYADEDMMIILPIAFSTGSSR